MKLFTKKNNAQRSAERQTARTKTLHKIEAVAGGYHVVLVQPAPAAVPQAKAGRTRAARAKPASAPATPGAAVPIKWSRRHEAAHAPAAEGSCKPRRISPPQPMRATAPS